MSGLRVTGAIVGAILAAIGSALAFAAVVAGCYSNPDVSNSAIPLGVVAALFLAAAAGAFFTMSRLVAKLWIGVQGAAMLMGGAMLLIAAPILHQVRSGVIHEGRASGLAYIVGVILVALGLAMAVLGLVWLRSPEVRKLLNKGASVMAIGYGVVSFLAGLIAAFSLPLASTIERDYGETTAAVAVAIAVGAAICLVPGTILVYHGISSAMGEASSRFKPPFAIVAAVLFLVVLLAGGVFMAGETPPAALMPPIHILAALLPPAVIVALVMRGSLGRGRPSGCITWRQALMAAGLSVAIAFTFVTLLEVLSEYAAFVPVLARDGAFRAVETLDDLSAVCTRPETLVTPRMVSLCISSQPGSQVLRS